MRQLLQLVAASEGGNTFREAKEILRHCYPQDAKHFGKMDQSAFSKQLAKAELYGLITRPAMDFRNITYELANDARWKLFREPWVSLESRLIEASCGVFQTIRVVNSHVAQRIEKEVTERKKRDYSPPDEDVSAAIWERFLSHFGDMVSPHLYGLIFRAKLIGVTYGLTIRCATESMAFLPNSEMTDLGPGRRTVFPLSGDIKVRENWASVESTSIAQRMAEILNARDEPLSLRELLFTGRIPRKYSADYEHYVKIFGAVPFSGDTNPLSSAADAILTSVGSLNSAEALWHDGEIAERIEETARIVGDIGGVIVAKTKDDEAVNLFHRPGNIGLNQTILRTVAARGRPGVIVVAAGANKVEIVLNAIEQGLVSHAIVDTVLATGMKTALTPAKA